MPGIGKTCFALFVMALFCASCRSVPAERVSATSQRAHCPRGALSVIEEGSGPPLVMLGGVLTGATGLEPLAAHLIPHRRVIRLQNLNVQTALEGASLPSAYSIRSESCGLSAAMENHGLDGPVDVVGYSYGGVIALDFALRHPELVRSLTLVEPPARWVLSQAELRSPEQSRFTEAASRIRRRIPSDGETARFICIVFGCSAGDELQQARQLPLWPTADRNRAALAGVYSLVEYRAPASLATLRPPLLYVSGSRTSAFHGMINARFKQLLPRARHLEVAGGHAAPSVSSASLAAAILEFTSR